MKATIGKSSESETRDTWRRKKCDGIKKIAHFCLVWKEENGCEWEREKTEWAKEWERECVWEIERVRERAKNRVSERAKEWERESECVCEIERVRKSKRVEWEGEQKSIRVCVCERVRERTKKVRARVKNWANEREREIVEKDKGSARKHRVNKRDSQRESVRESVRERERDWVKEGVRGPERECEMCARVFEKGSAKKRPEDGDNFYSKEMWVASS